MTRFSHLLRMYLAFVNLTTKQSGKDIGVSASTISRLCKGDKPDADTLIKLINWMFKS